MFGRALAALTSSTVLRLVALAGALGWLAAFPIALVQHTTLLNQPNQPFGGDFASFYTAGRLVLAGRGGELYDLGLQQRTQAELLNAPGYAALVAYVNPPVWAVLFAPLAALPYKLAYVVCTAGLLAAFLGALHVLRPHVPRLHGHWGTVVGLTWLFYPICRTVTAGQNTTVTLLLLTLIYAGLRGGRPLRVGIALGLLTYKPQFALLIGALLLIQRQWRAVFVAGALGGVHYLLGAVVCGPSWPLNLLRTLSSYNTLENVYNGATSVALLGWHEYWLPPAWGRTLGWVGTAAIVGAVLWTYRTADGRRSEFALHWGLAVTASVLVSPHTQWYDAGLVVLPVLLALDHCLVVRGNLSVAARFGLLAAFVLFPLYEPAARSGHIQPLILLPLGVLLWLARLYAAAHGSEPRTQVRAPAAVCPAARHLRGGFGGGPYSVGN